MPPIHPSFAQLLPLFFPPQLLEFFAITNTRETTHPQTGDITLTITLEEKNTALRRFEWVRI